MRVGWRWDGINDQVVYGAPAINPERAGTKCAFWYQPSPPAAHEMTTGYPNDALVAYIQATQQEAGCPAETG